MSQNVKTKTKQNQENNGVCFVLAHILDTGLPLEYS